MLFFCRFYLGEKQNFIILARQWEILKPNWGSHRKSPADWFYFKGPETTEGRFTPIWLMLDNLIWVSKSNVCRKHKEIQKI